ncbi:MAG: hypothetical protein SGJ18_13750 [Pseudomonadota bacterium]|nr:hypothetical protein [Pseudomonadota bacterium]
MNVGRLVAPILLTLSVALSNTGCGKLTLSLPQASTIVDFLKTEIVVGGSNLADGIAEMVVIIHLKNSDNTVVPNYKPMYQVTSSAGITAGECTTSSNEGVSVCVLKSTSAGTKVLKLTNALIGLEKIIDFQALAGSQIFGVASGARKGMTTPAGHKINLSAGESPKGQKSVTAGGYKVFSGVGTTMDSM